jgi:hypothetical protein
MPMKHIETKISETSIRIRYANEPRPEAATEWLEFEVPLAPLGLPTPSGDAALGSLGSLHTQFLSAIQLAALQYVRDAIGEETQRLEGLTR